MNKLSPFKQAAIIRALTQGCSIRVTARMVGVSKDTVAKLLVEFGEFASIYQDHKMRNLSCAQLEIDEIWSFVGAKDRDAKSEHGDIWTFTALDATSKLMVSWLIGPRSSESAHALITDVLSRLTVRAQITTDGHGMYPEAVAGAVHWKTKGVVYAQLVKEHGRSYVERSNFTMRMQIRGFTRLPNAFSKKAQNHAYSVSAFYMIYNFCRAHATLTKTARGTRTTPAMAAGLTDHAWTVEDVLGMIDPKKMLQPN